MNLRDLTPGELRDHFEAMGEASYRGQQVAEWIFGHRVDTFDAMTNLGKELRARLDESATVGSGTVRHVARSTDGTRKYLIGFPDGAAVEAVMIPEKNRRTLCVSTQVGCSLACRFCCTARMKLDRNLTPGEVVEQLFLVDEDLERSGEPAVTNIVYMGMGEPLMNMEGTLKSLEILTSEDGVNFPPSRITLSTSGVTGRLETILEQTRVNVALSLHAPEDELRTQLMPHNKKYPIGDLLTELRGLEERIRGRVTFEYVLLDGVNDFPSQARALGRLIRGIPAKVNLIPFNPFRDAPYRRPDDRRIDAFRRTLLEVGVDCTVRRSRGDDIAAACGQLRLERTPEED